MAENAKTTATEVAKQATTTTTTAVANENQSASKMASDIENANLKARIAELEKLVKTQTAPSSKPAPASFDLKKSLSKVNPKYLRFVAKELDKTEDKENRYKELKAELDNFEKTDKYIPTELYEYELAKKKLETQIDQKTLNQEKLKTNLAKLEVGELRGILTELKGKCRYLDDVMAQKKLNQIK